MTEPTNDQDQREHLRWVPVDPKNPHTWPLIGARVLAQRNDGMYFFMKRNSQDFMWYLRYPRTPALPIHNINRFAYVRDEMLSPRSKGFIV